MYHLTLEVVNFHNYVNTKGFHKIQPSLRGKTNMKLLWIPNFWKQKKCNLTQPKVKSKHYAPLGIRAGYLVPPADHWEQATLGPPKAAIYWGSNSLHTWLMSKPHFHHFPHESLLLPLTYPQISDCFPKISQQASANPFLKL